MSVLLFSLAAASMKDFMNYVLPLFEAPTTRALKVFLVAGTPCTSLGRENIGTITSFI
jgi:hypothetical protein